MGELDYENHVSSFASQKSNTLIIQKKAAYERNKRHNVNWDLAAHVLI